MSRLLAVALLGSVACAASRTDESDAAPPTRLEVENRSSLDMDIYVRGERGGTMRIGLAPGGEITSFALTPALLAGAGVVRLEGRPVRGQGQSILSEPYRVQRGSVITWSVPPQ
ncbi:MAG TPA: hypothetical protein VMN37_06190 [Gemmatimonadales bacterium]|nr:hypothetical protein [Gemmatimonadales bacterium]